MDIRLTLPAVLVVVPIAIVVAAVVAYRARTADRRTLMLRLTFVAYLAAVVSVTLFPFQVVIGKYAGGITFGSLQLLPLLRIDPTNFALNVILFIPFGLLFPLVIGHGTLRRTFVAGMLTSLTIEILQLLHALLLDGGRATDIDDLIANTLGTVAGYALLRLLLAGARERKRMMEPCPPPTVPVFGSTRESRSPSPSCPGGSRGRPAPADKE